MNWEIEQKREEIEDLKEEIESYGFFIEKVNPDNVWELEEEEFNEVLKGLNQEIIEQIRKHEIPLFYTKLGSFYPFLEHKTEDFLEFLENYRQEMRDWYKRELDAFENYEEAESIYKIYCELFDMQEEKVDSWYQDEFDTCSWREVYISKGNGVVFLRDVGGYGDDIIIMNTEWDINEIIEKLKAGEPLYRFSQ